MGGIQGEAIKSESINSSLMRLEEGVAELSGRIEDLYQQLEPVRRISPPATPLSGGASPTPEQKSTIRERIDGIARGVGGLVGKVHMMMKETEL